MNITCFTVSWAHGAHRDAGVNLLQQKYRRYYEVEPSVPDTFLVAVLEGRVVATIVVEKIERAETSLMTLYDTPRGSLRANEIVQWGRFTADAPFARAAICYGAAVYSLRISRNTVLLEAKPIPVRRHALDGVELEPVPGARLMPERAHDSVRLYYETPPPPILYRVEVEHVLRLYTHLLTQARVNITLSI